ncbi:hypothetical protein [Amphritea japonica]|uniref:Uncharacterized protein n=1 Tax=Amphritea japonica ATCC BAA-1530 TaxID=1278309 RepID=A0A7R6STI7_9GAMM|nr:hypothetical protein [Amphritea japonica]BBB26657.1 conserved hypothetical protein [Amphritea japonica ATCC BAA-1530]
MRSILIVVLLIIGGLGAYLLLQQPQSAAPVGTPKQQPDELSRMAAERHIDNLTSKPEQIIEIGQANNFVTRDQLLQLPAGKATTTAGTEAIESGNATTFGVQLEQIGSPSQPQKKMLSVGQLPQADQIKLQELLNNPDTAADTLFYIHGVSDADKQGLWGIIQSGLIDTFARGIQLENRQISTDIPQVADERMANSTSSFLGSILDEKVKDTYVYNYAKGVLGHNPNLINPGQELIIVSFTQDELINIYNHFNKQ